MKIINFFSALSVIMGNFNWKFPPQRSYWSLAVAQQISELHQIFEPMVAPVWDSPQNLSSLYSQKQGLTCFIATLGSSPRDTSLATPSILSVKISPMYSQRTSGCPRKVSYSTASFLLWYLGIFLFLFADVSLI